MWLADQLAVTLSRLSRLSQLSQLSPSIRSLMVGPLRMTTMKVMLIIQQKDQSSVADGVNLLEERLMRQAGGRRSRAKTWIDRCRTTMASPVLCLVLLRTMLGHLYVWEVLPVLPLTLSSQ